MDYPNSYVMLNIISDHENGHGVIQLKDIQRMNLASSQNDNEGGKNANNLSPPRFEISLNELRIYFKVSKKNNDAFSFLERRVLVDEVRLRTLRHDGMASLLHRCFKFNSAKNYGTLLESCERKEHMASLIWYLLESGWNVSELELAPLVFITPAQQGAP